MHCLRWFLCKGGGGGFHWPNAGQEPTLLTTSYHIVFVHFYNFF
uniref:Uncharacterized protein n=1 Tax=Anguilla anguilla TaxID=7936 RepID=A0A0E9SGX7_ANGAN